jgi:predicted RNase H-like HicB family nuclease
MPQVGALYNDLVNVKVIIEEHSDGFVAYPVGLKGVVVAQGDTYEEALLNVESAIRFHTETFGPEALDAEDSAIHVFVAETAIAV